MGSPSVSYASKQWDYEYHAPELVTLELSRPDIEILAVHGTFADDPEWVNCGSLMHTGLTERLEGLHLYWGKFLWSGENSHAAREFAASRLCEKILEIKAQRPRVRLFLLTHSHGGNVGLLALAQNPEVRKYVAGLICLSTPFIHVKLRDSKETAEEESEQWMTGVHAAPVIALIPAIVVGYFLNGIIAMLAWVGFCVLSYRYFLSRTENTTEIDILRHQMEVLQKYCFDHVKTPILAIRTSLDEALWWVRLVSGVAEAPVRVHRPLNKFSSWVIALAGLLFIVVPIVLIPAIFLVVVMPITRLIVTRLRRFLRGGRWGWGESSRASGAVNYVACKLPPQGIPCTEKVIGYVPSGPWWRFRLRHSFAYESEAGIETVAKFVYSASGIV